jgi:hypothetical protein
MVTVQLAKLFGLGLGPLLALDMATPATAGVYFFHCRYDNKGCGTATGASFHASNMQQETTGYIDTSTLNTCGVISGNVSKVTSACTSSGVTLMTYSDNNACTADTGNTQGIVYTLTGIDTCIDDADDGQGGPGTTSRYAVCYPFVSAPTQAQMETVCALGANPTSNFTDVTAAPTAFKAAAPAPVPAAASAPAAAGCGPMADGICAVGRALRPHLCATWEDAAGVRIPVGNRMDWQMRAAGFACKETCLGVNHYHRNNADPKGGPGCRDVYAFYGSDTNCCAPPAPVNFSSELVLSGDCVGPSIATAAITVTDSGQCQCGWLWPAFANHSDGSPVVTGVNPVGCISLGCSANGSHVTWAEHASNATGCTGPIVSSGWLAMAAYQKGLKKGQCTTHRGPGFPLPQTHSSMGPHEVLSFRPVPGDDRIPQPGLHYPKCVHESLFDFEHRCMQPHVDPRAACDVLTMIGMMSTAWDMTDLDAAAPTDLLCACWRTWKQHQQKTAEIRKTCPGMPTAPPPPPTPISGNPPPAAAPLPPTTGGWTYQAAKQACNGLGMYIASIHSEAELADARTAILLGGVTKAWVGAEQGFQSWSPWAWAADVSGRSWRQFFSSTSSPITDGSAWSYRSNHGYSLHKLGDSFVWDLSVLSESHPVLCETGRAALTVARYDSQADCSGSGTMEGPYNATAAWYNTPHCRPDTSTPGASLSHQWCDFSSTPPTFRQRWYSSSTNCSGVPLAQNLQNCTATSHNTSIEMVCAEIPVTYHLLMPPTAAATAPLPPPSPPPTPPSPPPLCAAIPANATATTPGSFRAGGRCPDCSGGVHVPAGSLSPAAGSWCPGPPLQHGVHVSVVEWEVYDGNSTCTGTPDSILYIETNACIRSERSEWIKHTCMGGQTVITQYSDSTCANATATWPYPGYCGGYDGEATYRPRACSSSRKTCTYNPSCLAFPGQYWQCFMACS